MSVWQKLFGESQKDAWTRLAAELGTTFEPGGFFGAHAVRARLGGYDLVLDTYQVSSNNSSQTYTRLRAPFVNPSKLRFRIFRASYFSALATAFGRQDLEIGVAGFDDDFVIQGSDEAHVRALLSDAGLRGLIAAQPRISVRIDDDEGLFGPSYGPAVDVLTFTESGIIRDVPRLRGLFSLFAALLQTLQQGAQSLLGVPPAELPAVFLRALDTVAESLGGGAERVRDSVEARVPNPVGLTEGARCVAEIPRLPALTTTFTFEAPLPAGSEGFTVEKRGALALGAVKTGDQVIDAALAVRGTGAVRPALLRPLRAMAAVGPDARVDDAGVTVSAKELPGDQAPVLLGAALDLWVELTRARAGEQA
ncbi:MAG: hypothetical protein HYS27_24590 [Deltaproteobacteria bacterium]|nr:hypothetical protein [Deltaproteobacteria bacterium]